MSASGSVDLTPKQAVNFRRISGLSFSPDGSHLACVVSQVKGPTVDSHVWMLDTVKGGFRQFTFSEKNEKSPAWAPDGRALAFLSNRGGQMQVYLMSPVGGEASAITASSDGVSDFRWSPDGTQIAFIRGGDRFINPRVWVMHADGSVPVQVTFTQSYYVAWAR